MTERQRLTRQMNWGIRSKRQNIFKNIEKGC